MVMSVSKPACWMHAPRNTSNEWLISMNGIWLILWILIKKCSYLFMKNHKMWVTVDMKDFSTACLLIGPSQLRHIFWLAGHIAWIPSSCPLCILIGQLQPWPHNTPSSNDLPARNHSALLSCADKEMVSVLPSPFSAMHRVLAWASIWNNGSSQEFPVLF